MFVIFSAVEKPALKINEKACLSSILFASSTVMTPFSIAFRFSLSGSIPAPSSFISITTWLPSWYADKLTVPILGLPFARRASGVSTPWSQEFLIMCKSGSPIDSITCLSSSVSSPDMINSISLPVSLAISRTTRGNLLNTLPIAIILVFIIASCSSVVFIPIEFVATKSCSTRYSFSNLFSSSPAI